MPVETTRNLIQRVHDAVAIYEIAAANCGSANWGAKEKRVIVPIRSEHLLAFYALSASSVGFRCRPTDASSVTFVTTDEGLFCPRYGVSALEVLLCMEHACISAYENILPLPELPVRLRSIIEREFAPQCRRHVVSLEELQPYKRRDHAEHMSATSRT